MHDLGFLADRVVQTQDALVIDALTEIIEQRPRRVFVNVAPACARMEDLEPQESAQGVLRHETQPSAANQKARLGNRIEINC